MVVEVDKVVDYDDIIRRVQDNTEMIALSARDDLKLTLSVLRELHAELCLHQFDYIQIHRGGVDLLRIILKKEKDNQIGRSAFVELNEYRRRLQQIARPEQLPGAQLVMMFVCGMVTALAFFAGFKYLQ
jgi:hypothetical protein